MCDYSFETDDVFDRKRYAEFLLSIIQNCDSFQRTDENRSYTICLDSGYGTGKSVFLSKLRYMIESDFDKNGIGVVSYNAWQNDFYDNAFIPFLYALLNDQWLKDARKADNEKGFAVKARRGLISTGKVIAKSYIKQKFGEEVAELAITALDGAIVKVKGPMDDVLTDYKKLKQNIEDFNTFLGSCLDAWQLDKLVIIIDELDRCKPDFAIQTLEITKHLMNVKDVVFLFALDKNQLCRVTEKVYGYGIDSEGYLRKFFDYVTVMPLPSISKYISEKFGKMTGNVDIDNSVINFMEDSSGLFLLSLRDVDTIIMSYRLLLIGFLRNYKGIDAHHLYLTCLILKYKYPEIFNSILITDTHSAEHKYPYVNQSRVLKHSITARIIHLSRKKIGDKDKDYSIYNYQGGESHRIHGISAIANGCITHKVAHNSIYLLADLQIDSSLCSIDGIIYREEWNDWQKYMGMTYGLFLHKRLEMFNFQSH